SIGAFERSLYLVTMLVVQVAVFITLALLCWHEKQEMFLRPVPLVLVTSILACMGFLMFVAQSYRVVEAWFAAVMGAALFGSGLAFMSLFWLSSLRSLTYRGSYLCLVGSHAAATVASALILLMPPQFDGAVTLGCFLLSGVCAVALPRTATVANTLASQAGDVFRLVWRGLLCVCVFAFLSGLVSQVSGQITTDPASLQGFMLIVSGGVLVVMSIPALVFDKPFKIEDSYRAALPLSTLGFLVLPFLIGGLPEGVLGILVTSGYMLVGIVLYCSVAEMSKVALVPLIPLLACCEAVTLGCRLAGIALGYPLAHFMTENSAVFAVVGLALLYLIVFGASLLSKGLGRREGHRLEGADGPGPGPGQLTSVTRIAEQNGLSEREADILQLLASGRTMRRIGEDRYLSTSAVKYHTLNLYRRFDVHSREELLLKLGQLERTMARDAAPVPRKETAPGGMPSTSSDSDTLLARCHDLAAQHGLTTREQEVLPLLARGASVGLIAATLEVSENTAKTHVKRVYAKLGIHSKQEVIDLFMVTP
ncbi:MAG: helix-turn-helix transcriptional regulator, partial [Coriobacteriales bacterium]|nr:helix-turn-helix transcriptional regulator [Coriobacteriales bacterium]